MSQRVHIALLARQKGRWKQEVEFLEREFRRADVNGDGKVDMEEYIAILKARGIFTDRKQIERIFSVADVDGDRQLARTELRDEIIRLKNVDGVFNIIDKDKSGTVSPAELAARTTLDKDSAEKAIKKMDKDNDGQLDRREFHRMINKNRIKHPERRRVDLTFDSLDQNKDGFIDRKELSSTISPSQAYFVTKSKRVDKNRDGKLSKKEFKEFLDHSHM